VDLGGAQHVYGITPDLSTFGKALANGFSLSALVGRRDLMELGGSTTVASECFSCPRPTAPNSCGWLPGCHHARVPHATVIETLYARGDRLREGVERHIHNLGLGPHFCVTGRSCSLQFNTLGPDRQPSQAFRTLFLQELLARDILAPPLSSATRTRRPTSDATIDAAGEAAPASTGRRWPTASRPICGDVPSTRLPPLQLTLRRRLNHRAFFTIRRVQKLCQAPLPA